MLPFDIEIRAGASVHEQVVHAVERALVAGALKAGDRFPSVRSLSKELRINPNTALKIVATLVDAGVLEVRPGIGTLVAETTSHDNPRRRQEVLGPRLEKLVVDASRVGIELDELQGTLESTWHALVDKGAKKRKENGND